MEITHIDDFATIVSKRRKDLAQEKGISKSKYPLDSIAKSLDMSLEELKKKINFQKPQNKRDFVIALALELEIYDLDKIDEMLHAYGMPKLDDGLDKDSLIIEFIRNKDGKAKELADMLFEHNYELNVIDKRKIKNIVIKKNKYKIEKRYIKESEELDQYNSLETEFFTRKKYTGVLEVIDNKTKEKIEIEVYKGGSVSLDSFSSEDELYRIKQMYGNEIRNLSFYIEKKIKRDTEMIDDTKYYSNGRSSAILENDNINIFSERYSFNNGGAFRKEYYFLEYKDNKYIFSIYKKSKFMKKLLGDEYIKYFAETINEPEHQYEFYERVDELKKVMNKDYFDSIRWIIEELKDSVDSLFLDLKNKKKFIRNFEYIFISPLDVLKFYEITKDFKAVYHEEVDEIKTCESSAIFTTEDGEKIEITLDDVERAFELGFKNINQICAVKRKYGTVEAVLEKVKE